MTAATSATVHSHAIVWRFFFSMMADVTDDDVMAPPSASLNNRGCEQIAVTSLRICPSQRAPPLRLTSDGEFFVPKQKTEYDAQGSGLHLKFRPTKLSAENRLDYRACFCMLQAIMKRHFPFFCMTATAIAFLVSCCCSGASAHERDTFKIGDKYYVFTVGSLNEPFVVDNTSGVDLRVAQLAGPPAAGSAKQNSTAVTGLEQTLKVELAAGDKKETLTFDPSDEAPGSYAANFIPTVQTTYSYRIFGTFNKTPVDLTFTCVPGVSLRNARKIIPK